MRINSVNNHDYKPNFGIVRIDGRNFQRCNPAKNRQIKRFIKTLDAETFNTFGKVFNNQINNHMMNINIEFNKATRQYGVFLTPTRSYKVLPNGKSNYKPGEKAEIAGTSFTDALEFADRLATAEKDVITSFKS